MVDDSGGEPMLDPDHPMLARVQEALRRQMSKAREVKVQRLQDQREELARQVRKREDVGVKLYQAQQQLAKLQMGLEKAHDNGALVHQQREEAEAELGRVRGAYGEALGESKELRGRYEKYQSELDQLAATIRQVEAFNEQMRSEIAVTRRATYKAEEAVSKLEGDKRSQDHLIDALSERLKREQEQLSLTEAQITSQRKESEGAQSTLRAASEEMEAIRFEKRQLQAQWKTSLVGLEKRDEALQAAEEAIRKQGEQRRTLEAQSAGLRKAVLAEEEGHEQLTSTSNKLGAELRGVEAQIEAGREKRAAAEERVALIHKSLEQTEAEIAREGADFAQRQREVAAVEGQVQKVQQAARRLEESVLSSVGEKVALERGTHHAMQEAKKVRQKIDESETAEAQLRNELARLKVDGLNVRSHSAQLESQLAELNEELEEADGVARQYEVESRRREVEVEKKQHELDGLNRKFEALMEKRAGVAGLDEDAGPLEATIASLKKEIGAKAADCAQTQQRWVQKQAELVAVETSNGGVADAMHEQRSRLAILRQKQLRFAAELEGERKERKAVERASESQRLEMSKVNRAAAEFEGKQSALAEENYAMEAGFKQRLKECEVEALELEARIISLKEEKEQYLLDVTEAEKQARLIEEKIALQRETRAALDPTVGASETRAMQREIHRMQLRYSQLQRRQEMMVADMERNVYKRDNIEAKGKTAAGRKGAPPTQAALRKQVDELSKKLRATTQEANVTQLEVKKLLAAQQARGEEVDRAHRACEEAKAAAREMQRAVANQELEARLLELPLRQHERLVGKLRAAADGSYQPTAQLSQQLAESEVVAVRLQQVASELSAHFTHLAPQIQAAVAAT